MATDGTEMRVEDRDAVLGTFEKFCDLARNVLPSFMKALEQLNQRSLDIEEIGPANGERLSVELSMVLQEMKVFLSSMKGKGRLFVQAYIDMATFVCESGVMVEVKHDLETQSVEELLYFVDDMKEYLKTCERRLTDFDVADKAFHAKVTQTSELWESRRRESEEAEEASRNHRDRAKFASDALALVGRRAIDASRELRSLHSNAALCVRAIGETLCLGSFVAGFLVPVFDREKGISEKERAVLADALKQVMVFSDARATLVIGIQVTITGLELSKDYIEGKDGECRGLEIQASSPEYREKRGLLVLRESAKICTALVRLESCMKEGLAEARLYMGRQE